jgi:nicotinamidase-related amidase
MNSSFRHLAVVAVAFVALLAFAGPANAQTVLDEWNTAVAPSPPPLKPATIDPKTTAFLVLDILKQNCSAARPRCQASVPHIQSLLTTARAKGMLIVYSGFPGSNPAVDVLPQVAPLGTEPMVTTTGDKFINTNLDAILKAKGIKTLLIAGSATNNAVLYTVSDATQRGYYAVVPIDCMSSAGPYFDQYVIVQFTAAAGVNDHTTLTRSDMVTFGP